MSTLNPTPPPDREAALQAQIDAMSAKLAQLESAKAERAPWPLWAKFSAWIGKKHWTWKTAVIAYAAIASYIAGNPAAHAAFLDLWAHVPKWAVDVVGIAGPLVAAAVSGNKSPQT